MTKKIRYRPHHFLCSVGWQGMGYSKDFSLNMDSIVDGTLRAPGGDSTIIEVVKYTDDLCSPCPHRREKLCEKQEAIEKLDNTHSKKLGLKIGKNITWGDAKKLIRKKVVPTDLNKICEGCQWLEYGVCAKALGKLIQESDD